MPRVIALGKLQKKLRKRKGEKLDSLGDRDKKRLTTAALREQKLKALATARSKGREREMGGFCLRRGWHCSQTDNHCSTVWILQSCDKRRQGAIERT